MKVKYAREIELARMRCAMEAAEQIGKTRRGENGEMLFSRTVCGQDTLSNEVEVAKKQMKDARISYHEITPAEAFGLTDGDWVRVIAGKTVIAFQLINKEEGYFIGRAVPSGRMTKVKAVDSTNGWILGHTRFFLGTMTKLSEEWDLAVPRTLAEMNEYRTNLINSRKRNELIRCLERVEMKAAEGQVYVKGVQKCRDMGVADHPDLSERLAKAISPVENKMLAREADKLEKRGRQFLGYIRNNLSKYWYQKGEDVVCDMASRLSHCGCREQAQALLSELDSLKTKSPHRLFA